MKKYFMYALCALTIATTVSAIEASLPSQARSALRSASASAQRFAQNSRQVAKAHVYESIARLQKCIKIQCTRGEALKAARDLVVAVGLLYAAGIPLKRGGRELYHNYPQIPRRVLDFVGREMYGAGMLLQAPVNVPVNVFKKLSGRVPQVGEIYPDESQKFRYKVTAVTGNPLKGYMIYYDKFKPDTPDDIIESVILETF